MTNLKDFIKEKRPKLGASSIVTYCSILTNLYKRVFSGDVKDIDIKKFDETEKILAHLKSIPSAKRKTILSALVVVTDDKKYRDLMLSDIKEYNTEIAKQEKTPEEEANWVDTTQVTTLFNTLKANAELLYKKQNLSAGDLQEIQSYIILALLSGVYVAPRRAKDLCDFKIKAIDKKVDNYLLKNELIYNSYKTAKVYGEQKVECPPELKKLLAKWIKVNPTDYLLFDGKNKKLSSVQLNQRLNRLFGGKKIGINLMRKSYLTGKFHSSIEENKRIADTMTAMGSSSTQLPHYVLN